MSAPLRITVWGENVHERIAGSQVAQVYPRGMHTTIAEGLAAALGAGAALRTATLEQERHGLAEEVLATTDVLVWWGHRAHDEVSDEVASAVVERVLGGMGFVVLHSAMHSKPFLRLMGTSCNLHWREEGEREVVWVVSPSHPVARGLPPSFVVPQQEMYGEYFDIPAPDELVFISSFAGGEVFRSGCCFVRGKGRIFYFSPGHETYPVYYQPEIQRVLANAVEWAYAPEQPDVVRTESPRSPFGWYETT